MELPELTVLPKFHPDCCASLSTTFLESINSLLRPSSQKLVLSIGSGTGLLEALLQRHCSRNDVDITIEGVEVTMTSSRQPVNIYLPEESITTVHGTRDLTPRVERANVLLFVYPRDPWLVARYVEFATEKTRSLDLIIWIGPKVDWPDFETAFEKVGAGFTAAETVDDAGLVEYELMMVMRHQLDSDTT